MSPEAQDPRVEAFSWDEENEAHLRERHPDITPEDVDSILEGTWLWLQNRKGRAAILVLGVDRWNRRLTVPADPTGQKGVWRPHTAHQMTRWQSDSYDDATRTSDGTKRRDKGGQDER